MGHLPQKKLKFSKRSHISYLLQFTTVMKQEKYFSSAGPRDVYLLIQILNEIVIIFLDENAEQISNQMTTCSLNLRESLTRHCMMVFSKLKHTHLGHAIWQAVDKIRVAVGGSYILKD